MTQIFEDAFKALQPPKVTENVTESAPSVLSAPNPAPSSQLEVKLGNQYFRKQAVERYWQIGPVCFGPVPTAVFTPAIPADNIILEWKDPFFDLIFDSLGLSVYYHAATTNLFLAGYRLLKNDIINKEWIYPQMRNAPFAPALDDPQSSYAHSPPGQWVNSNLFLDNRITNGDVIHQQFMNTSGVNVSIFVIISGHYERRV